MLLLGDARVAWGIVTLLNRLVEHVTLIHFSFYSFLSVFQIIFFVFLAVYDFGGVRPSMLKYLYLKKISVPGGSDRTCSRGLVSHGS